MDICLVSMWTEACPAPDTGRLDTRKRGGSIILLNNQPSKYKTSTADPSTSTISTVSTISTIHDIYYIYYRTVTGWGRKQNCIMIIVAWATLDPCKHVNKEVDVDIQFLQYGSWLDGTQVHVILLIALAMWHNGRTKQNSGQGGVEYIKCFRCWQVSSRWCFQNS